MKKPGLLLMCLPLLLASCATERKPRASVVSIPVSSQGGSSLESSSVKASVDYGDDPTSVYEREDAQLVTRYNLSKDVCHIKYLDMENGYWPGPDFKLYDSESYANVDVIGQEDIGATVRGFSSGMVARGYDGTGEYLDGRNLKGMTGTFSFDVKFTGEVCRHPGEAYFRIVFFAKDNLDAITGYALIVAYPCGEPVEATDPNADIEYPELSEREPGPVWLDWTAEVVCEGVHFPKVEGLYQRVDPDRVEAALDIMIENAKGHYFQKAN
ncbi:MAG: hypothetical protein V3G53_04295 [Candidatus Enteromonas sp.]